jgi:hypothetical protein
MSILNVGSERVLVLGEKYSYIEVKSMIFWFVTSCSLVKVDRRFCRTYVTIFKVKVKQEPTSNAVA